MKLIAIKTLVERSQCEVTIEEQGGSRLFVFDCVDVPSLEGRVIQSPDNFYEFVDNVSRSSGVVDAIAAALRASRLVFAKCLTIEMVDPTTYSVTIDSGDSSNLLSCRVLVEPKENGGIVQKVGIVNNPIGLDVEQTRVLVEAVRTMVNAFDQG